MRGERRELVSTSAPRPTASAAIDFAIDAIDGEEMKRRTSIPDCRVLSYRWRYGRTNSMSGLPGLTNDEGGKP